MKNMSNTEMKRNLEDSYAESKKLKRDTVVEQDFINYFSLPSLESIAIVNVATGLCMQSDIRDAIRQHSFVSDPVAQGVSYIPFTSSDRSFIKKLENSILTKLSVVQLPSSLKAKVADMFTPLVLQMQQWIRHGHKYDKHGDAICWTIQGTIDKVKTFEKLVNKDSAQFYLKSFYELACRYCLEDSIFSLWNKLPKALQNGYEEKVYRKYDNHFIAYWISVVKNDLSGLLVKIKQYDYEDIYNCNNSLYKNMFTLAVYDGNFLAVKYFWNKLTNEEISSNLAQWINCSLYNRIGFDTVHKNVYDYSEVVFFLLSQMKDSNLQKATFKEHSKSILPRLFDDWPWQRFLLPTIQTIWLSLDPELYLDLMSNIVLEIEKNKTTYQLFRKLWQNSPKALKKKFIQDMMRFDSAVIYYLLSVGDVETIKLILNYANVEEKKDIMYHVVQNYHWFYQIIYTDKLSLFDTLLSDILSSDSEIQKLKEEILEYGIEVCCQCICDGNFQMVEKFFKWAFTSQDQIDSFKKNVLEMEATYKIIKNLGNYELVDKFMSWCFSNELEVNEFKKNFAKSNCKIITIGEKNWSEFEKFICWCFISNEDIEEFKRIILQSDEIYDTIYNQIADDCNFEFIEKLISWCYISNEQIKQFKKEFVFSSTWLCIIQKLVSKHNVDNSGYNWELTRKFFKLFFPLEEKDTIKLKKIIKVAYFKEGQNSLYQIRKKIFRLIDDNDCNIDDNNIISDSDNSD